MSAGFRSGYFGGSDSKPAVRESPHRVPGRERSRESEYTTPVFCLRLTGQKAWSGKLGAGKESEAPKLGLGHAVEGSTKHCKAKW